MPDPLPFHRLEELTPAELDAMDRDRTLIVLPVSPIEEHGPHLPLGTDGWLAKGFARGLAERITESRPDWSVVRAPWIPVGCYTLDWPGSVEVEQAAVRAVVVSYGRSFARHGFRHVVVVNGHGGPGHGAALEEACREVSRRCGIRMIYPGGLLLTEIFAGSYFDRIGDALGRPLTDDERAALAHDFHAGAMETSYLLKVRPDLVKGDPTELPDIDISKVGMMRYFWGDLVGDGPGYMGSPSRADVRLADAVESVFADEITALVERSLDGEDIQPEISGEFYRNPLFRTRARPVARAMEATGKTVLGGSARLLKRES